MISVNEVIVGDKLRGIRLWMNVDVGGTPCDALRTTEA